MVVRLEPHNYYGLGLGLTVVYEIVKLAGGSVQVESAKDKGTTVVMVTLMGNNCTICETWIIHA